MTVPALEGGKAWGIEPRFELRVRMTENPARSAEISLGPGPTLRPLTHRSAGLPFGRRRPRNRGRA